MAPPRRVEGAIKDTDFPSGEDRLNMQKSIQGFTTLLDRIEAPMLAIIDGEAGSGRSSYMQLVATALDSNSSVAPIWIDATCFRDHNYLFPAVLCQISREFGDNPELLEFVLRFNTSYEFAIQNKGFLDKDTISKLDYDNYRSRIEFAISPMPQGMDSYMGVDVLQDTFLQLTQALLPQTDRRAFVGFVDDLDQCDPEQIDRFLFDLYTYTAIPGSTMIWVLSLDVESFEKWASSHRNLSGRLDKVSNLIVRVPQSTSLRSLINHHLQSLGLPDAKSLGTPLTDYFEELEIYNPRIVKRAVSRVAYAKAFGGWPRPQLDQDVFMGLAIMREAYPEFFSLARRDLQAALMIFASAGNSYGNSNYSGMTLESVLKGLRTDPEPLLADRAFQRMIGKIGTCVMQAFGVRTSNVQEAVPKIRVLFNTADNLFG